MTFQHLGALLIGVFVGFLGGLFGKGGSAIATPLLTFLGLPGIVAVASPLPATIPGTFIASVEYWKSDLLDWQIVRWSIAVGVPATIVGSYLTEFTGPQPLLIITGLMVLGFGISFLLWPEDRPRSPEPASDGLPGRSLSWWVRLLGVAIGAGLISGLLANAGGFLLAPGFSRILRQPLKTAFACSLAVSVVLALPGTIVHSWLGHIDWSVTLFLALGSVPLSLLGAKVAVRSKPSSLARWYGAGLTILGAFFLIQL